MSLVLANINEFDAQRRYKLRIEAAYLYGVGDLVRQFLSRSMSAGEKFKVLKPVVGTIPVFMVDRLFGEEGASEVLFHNVPMFKHFAFWRVSRSRNEKPDVAVTSRHALNLAFFKWPQAFPLGKLESLSTFSATKLFLSIYRASRASLDWHPLTALDAVHGPCLVRKFLVGPRAVTTAIKRVLPVQFLVGLQLGLRTVERLSAFFARKLYPSDDIGLSSMCTFVGVVTGLRTVFSDFPGFCLKWRATVDASSINQHRFSPLVVQVYNYQGTSRRASDFIEIGVA